MQSYSLIDSNTAVQNAIAGALASNGIRKTECTEDNGDIMEIDVVNVVRAIIRRRAPKSKQHASDHGKALCEICHKEK